MRKLTSEELEELERVEDEGMDYFFINYTGSEYEGTELEEVVKNYRKAHEQLRMALTKLKIIN